MVLEARGQKVVDFVTREIRARKSLIRTLKERAQTLDPLVRELILSKVDRLDYSPAQIRQLNFGVGRFGLESLPTEASPWAKPVRAIWGPRMDVLSVLPLAIDQFGVLGELLIAAKLPGLRAWNVGPREILTPQEWRALYSSASARDLDWFEQFNRDNFEIDVVFREGRSIGEIKFYKTPKPLASGQDEGIRSHAERLSAFLQFLARFGIRKSAYFLFLGTAPPPETIAYLQELGLTVILSPLDFTALTPARE